ncbi:hypothetical protein [Salipiger sp. CCB-MM3]|uniref:hypothetical protein n=1 Tax=Salipiger sp. CCB-MM3 TaxID=1792508 RepID=UPI0012FB79F8|nr:hypothetical protein [Salipiger sp. CCB-MM3]
MKFTTVAVVLASFGATCGAAGADPAERLAEILTRDNLSLDNILMSKTTASFEGCILKLTLDKLDACSRGASFVGRENVIDIRVLKTQKEDVRVTETRPEHRTLPGAGLTYSYGRMYQRLLTLAYDASERILDEEYKRYPKDVEARLHSLSRRYQQEINPDQYSRSQETTAFCSGVKITKPLPSYSFTLYLQPENVDEFIRLLEDYAPKCESGASS